VVMALLAGSVGAVSSPLVLSCGGVGTTDVQEPGVEEPNGGGGLRGGTLPFSVRSRRIKCRMKARMALVSVSTILPSSSSLFLPLFSLMIFSTIFTERLER
jgi:hypothetical protein